MKGPLWFHRLLTFLLLNISTAASDASTIKASTANITTRQDASVAVPQIGAYYYPWWGNPSNVHWPNNVRDLLETRQEPFLGEYFNQNASIVNQHLQWANDYGISQFVAAWFGPNRFGDQTIRDYLLPSPARGSVQIGILYESPSRLTRDESDNKMWFNDTTNNAAQLLEDFEYLAEHYFNQDGYLTTTGDNKSNRPIVYMYLARSFSGDYPQAIQQLRDFVQDKYGYNIYLVADMVYWGRPHPEHLRVFDAVTAYNMHGPSEYEGYPDATGFLTDVALKYEEYQLAANDEGVALVPGIMPSYNDRGTRLENDNYVIPHETNAALEGTGQYSTFRESLQMAQRLLETATTTTSGGTLMITSWNEWHEDTNIEPTQGTQVSSKGPELYTQGYNYDDYGFALLDIVKEFRQSFLPPTTAPMSTTPTSVAPTNPPTSLPLTEPPLTALPTRTPSEVPSVSPIATTDQPSIQLPTITPSVPPASPKPSTSTPTTKFPQVRNNFALCLHRVLSAHLQNHHQTTLAATATACSSNDYCPPHFLDYRNNIFAKTTTSPTTAPTIITTAKGTPVQSQMRIPLNQGVWWCRKSSQRM